MVHQNGEKVTLQKVTVSKKGYITVQIWQKGKLCKIGTIPFQLVEELILCAPTGTHIECEVTDFMCSAEITKDCINIEIRVCQQVKAVAEAIIEVEADLCQPRSFTESKLI
ncbi:hypothetical protein SAMN04487944_12212 [Gracilibacillus ureilyticus]|uniref:Uncharacterized protein n=1 Tax=Gracilibacillus ureilyticus TaxID=531814 RepID=A0A1H9V886_9BACI|nr:hypothetical protein [Gracilibacillus ureilyticus]SES17915.1 hypothetical protein SAMN04487944_12212 [Gracilibacillus ureilyticus]